MSHTQDLSSMFLHCKDMFKTILLPKNNNNSHLSPKLLSMLNSFETKLTISIKELIPKDKNDILTLSWMIQAMESLCNTHESIKKILMDHVLNLEEDLIHMYYDISLKLLQLCNAFSSELNHLNHCNLLLNFGFTKLDTSNSFDFDNWNQQMVYKNPRIENCGSVLSELVESLHITKKIKKNQKLLFQALYGVKVKTLYIFSVFASAFSGSSKNLINLAIPKEMNELPWAKALMELHDVIKNTFLIDRFIVIKDLECVKFSVKKLYIEEEGLVLDLVEPLKKLVIEVSEKFDLFSKEICCFVKIVISTRDLLSDNLWKRYTEELKVTMPLMIKSVENSFINRKM